MAGHAKASSDRCPSWRQLYRITCTLSELAGIEPPKSAAAASALISQLEALQGGSDDGPALVTVTAGDGCPF
jgi:hypothetical protein